MSGHACDPSSALQTEASRPGAEPEPPLEPLPGAEQSGLDWAQQDWHELVPRLHYVAVSRLAHMIWRGCPRGGAPGPIEAVDVVNEAIAKTIAGVRPWRPEACSLFQHLAGVVAQEISHAASSSENRLTLAHRGAAGSAVDWPPDIADDAPDQERVALWRSEQRRLLDFLDGVDPRVAKMAELQLSRDVYETRELCVALAATPAEVANLRKRMKRAVSTYLKGIDP